MHYYIALLLAWTIYYLPDIKSLVYVTHARVHNEHSTVQCSAVHGGSPQAGFNPDVSRTRTIKKKKKKKRRKRNRTSFPGFSHAPFSLPLLRSSGYIWLGSLRGNRQQQEVHKSYAGKYLGKAERSQVREVGCQKSKYWKATFQIVVFLCHGYSSPPPPLPVKATISSIGRTLALDSLSCPRLLSVFS